GDEDAARRRDGGGAREVTGVGDGALVVALGVVPDRLAVLVEADDGVGGGPDRDERGLAAPPPARGLARAVVDEELVVVGEDEVAAGAVEGDHRQAGYHEGRRGTMAPGSWAGSTNK